MESLLDNFEEPIEVQTVINGGRVPHVYWNNVADPDLWHRTVSGAFGSWSRQLSGAQTVR
jgi:hypothetical protein